MKLILKNGLVIDKEIITDAKDPHEYAKKVVAGIANEEQEWFYFLESEETNKTFLLRCDSVDFIEFSFGETIVYPENLNAQRSINE